MTQDPGLFATLHSLRAMRRLKPDPIPDEMIKKILDTGTYRTSGKISTRRIPIILL